MHTSALRLKKRLLKNRFVTRAKHIGVYLPDRGEMSLKPWIESAWNTGQSLYLPMISNGQSKQLIFIRYAKNSALSKNAFNISEPIKCRHQIRAQHLDVILAPLVAFDRKGNRLGMGGGFYDRTFHYKCIRPYMKPYVIGIAYSWQEVEELTAEPWDVKLNAIATENFFRTFKS